LEYRQKGPQLAFLLPELKESLSRQILFVGLKGFPQYSFSFAHFHFILQPFYVPQALLQQAGSS
jgi:hypothetical protein